MIKESTPTSSGSFYIPRTLSALGKNYREDTLLATTGVSVILAEPGAGKTALLVNLAQQFNVKVLHASHFLNSTATFDGNALVLDGFDEVAKQGDGDFGKALTRIIDSSATQVYLASRSSEWEESRTQKLTDWSGKIPFIAQLAPFSNPEQREFYSHHFPEEAFDLFRAEVQKFELEQLLGNPMFLVLIAEAYKATNGRFESKEHIFKSAIDRLALEANQQLTNSNSPTTERKVALAREVFANLMMSGALGISTNHSLTNDKYPQLSSLTQYGTDVLCLLDTRFFIATENSNIHQPVHRLVAEYCAGFYLAERIRQTTNRLSLKRCLAIIAPNGVVRDDLRGLLGWLATFGNKQVQEAAIKLDPYAVVSSGDPSQLIQSSKIYLLEQLADTAFKDPFFRRADFWRNFSTAGFFSEDMMALVEKFTFDDSSQGQLRDLLLEMLHGSPAVEFFSAQLSALIFDQSEPSNTRNLALRCLINSESLNLPELLKQLIQEQSENSLRLTHFICDNGLSSKVEEDRIVCLLRLCASRIKCPIVPGVKSVRKSKFVFPLVNTLNLHQIEWYLDQLTPRIRCNCDEDKKIFCRCKISISRVVGTLLDRYFDINEKPLDPERIFQWIWKLEFSGSVSEKLSSSVAQMQSNDTLRQEVQWLMLTNNNDDRPLSTIYYSLNWSSHAGLELKMHDLRALVDRAYYAGKSEIWSCFIDYHTYYRSRKGENPPASGLRAHMRFQSIENSKLAGVWAKCNRDIRLRRLKEHNLMRKSYRSQKRRDRNKNERKKKTKQYIEANRQRIEAGELWNYTMYFAEYYLREPKEIEKAIGEIQLVESTLSNCIKLLASEAPTLVQLASAKRDHSYFELEKVLLAACLFRFRCTGSLDSVDTDILHAIVRELDHHHEGISDDEANNLRHIVFERIFSCEDDLLHFAKEFIEPQLAPPAVEFPDLQWLQKPTFSEVRGSLALKWLQDFPDLDTQSTDKLFNIALEDGFSVGLKKIIAYRCATFNSSRPGQEENLKLKRFWLLRHFYFFEDAELVEVHTNTDKDFIFRFREEIENCNTFEGNRWPILNAEKRFKILDLFVDQWPEVFLPNGWDSESPSEEIAYRFLGELVWDIGNSGPDDCLPILSNIIEDRRFASFKHRAQHLYGRALRKKALQDFSPPTSAVISKLFNESQVATVEDLRALIIEELDAYQLDICGGDFDEVDNFYRVNEYPREISPGTLPIESRVDEVTAAKTIAIRLKLRLESLGIDVVRERHVNANKRCDICAGMTLHERRILLMIEVKGQWEESLYTAAEKQLSERYSNHPAAEKQGVFLVLWFGGNEKIAKRKNRTITSAAALKAEIIKKLPDELHGLIDVFVLDLSRSRSS